MKIAWIGLVALAVAMGIGRFAFTPLMPMMLAEGSLSFVQGGWLASANYVGYLAGALSAAALRMGPVTMVRLGLALVAATTLAMAWTHAFVPQLAWRFLAGMASAWVLVSTSAWCLQRFEQSPERDRPMLGARLYSGVGIGIAFAGLACLLLPLIGGGAMAGWASLGIVATGATIVLALLMRADAPIALASPVAKMAWDATAWRLVVAYGIFGFGYIIPATFLSTMARQASPDPAVYGWSWPIFGAAAAASVFVAVRSRAKLGERGLWIAGHVVMAIGVALPIALDGLIGIVASGLLVGGTFMVVTMAGMQEARRVRGAGARPLMAAMTSSFALGQIAGPLLTSAFAARGIGYNAALAAAAIALLAACGLLIPTSEPSP